MADLEGRLEEVLSGAAGADTEPTTDEDEETPR